MFKKIAIGIAASLAVVIAGVLIFAATKSDTFHVQRSASIKAPPEEIFPLINDFRRWGSWSPWEKVDPAMKRTYSGAERGVGSAYAWDGNGDIGQGRMEIAEAVEPSSVKINLDFTRPFEAHNVAEFTLEPHGDITNVTWAMHGPNTYMGKVIQVFLSMDDMVGTQFEKGLANLKAVAEK